KLLSCILIAITFLRCTNEHRQPPLAPKTDTTNVSSNDEVTLEGPPGIEEKDIRYSDEQLEHFLDSIGRLPTQPLMNKVQFQADSVFKSDQPINHDLTKEDFETLKTACREGYINKETVLRILPGFFPDESSLRKDTMVNLVYFPFGKEQHGFAEFAVCSG